MSFSFPGTGGNRLEIVPELGRPFRVGSPEALARSNANVVREALQDRRTAEAKAWLEYLHMNDMFMLRVYAEWSVMWHAFSARRFGSAGAIAVQQRALQVWSGHSRAEPNLEEPKATLHALLAAVSGESDAANNVQQLADGIFQVPRELFQKLSASVEASCGPETVILFDDYFKCVRVRHDLIAQYCWAFPTAVCEIHGQKIAEEALAGSFGSMSIQDAMWTLFASLPPPLRAAFLAEHLRFHFSGTGREGSVQIVEEPDRYRLVFDPCGSGGAMRRDAGTNPMAIFSNASPLTWGRKNEVPAYCAHCAFNELTSVQRVGYPLWVTEFHPDANKPCGWTVFKDPAKIPPAYFSRLGATPPQ